MVLTITRRSTTLFATDRNMFHHGICKFFCFAVRLGLFAVCLVSFYPFSPNHAFKIIFQSPCAQDERLGLSVLSVPSRVHSLNASLRLKSKHLKRLLRIKLHLLGSRANRIVRTSHQVQQRYRHVRQSNKDLARPLDVMLRLFYLREHRSSRVPL